MRKSGFSNVDGFDNAAALPSGENFEVMKPSRTGFSRVNGFDNAAALAEGGKYEIVISNADGDDDADGVDEFVFDEYGNFAGDEGEFNAAGEHYSDAPGVTPFHFNADGEYDPEGDHDADGDHFETFLPGGFSYRKTGFFGVDGEDDNFMNAKGKRAAKQAAKQERKTAKAAGKQARKTAKVEAKVAKKAAKTEIKKAKAAAKVEKKQAKTSAKIAKGEAKQARKTERMQLRNQPAEEIELPPIPGVSYPEQEASADEQPLEIGTDPLGTNVDMTDPQTGAPIDMQAIEEIAETPAEYESQEEIIEDTGDTGDDNFLSAAGKARRTARRAVKKAAKTQKKVAKTQAKAGKAIAKTTKKANKADAVKTRADSKAATRGTRADSRLELAKQGIAPGASIAQSVADTARSAASAIAAVRSGRPIDEPVDETEETGDTGSGDSEKGKKKIKPGKSNTALLVVGGLALLGLGAALFLGGKKKAA